MPGKKKNLSDDSAVNAKIKMGEAYEKAVDKLLLQLQYNKLLLDIQEPEHEDDDELVKQMKQLNIDIKKRQKQKPGQDYYFVGVSPVIGTDFELFKCKVQKYTTRSMIRSAIYCYELSKQSNPHVHILVENSGYTDKDFRRNTYNTFKKIVGDQRCVDIKAIPEEWVQDKIDYIKGIKWDKSKDTMIEADIEWRKSMSLEPYYKIGTKFE